MKIKTSLLLCLALAAVVLLGAPLVAMAAHPTPVNLKDAAGANVTATTPYSPKMTCGGCHVADCITTPTIATNTKKYCETEAERTALGSTADYGHGVINAAHTQGVIAGTGTNQVYWQSYNVKSFAHGVSIGRHANQGRNEDYTTEMRTVFGDPFFTSSPGMFGKY
jgi:hypothetical protein